MNMISKSEVVPGRFFVSRSTATNWRRVERVIGDEVTYLCSCGYGVCGASHFTQWARNPTEAELVAAKQEVAAAFEAAAQATEEMTRMVRQIRQAGQEERSVVVHIEVRRWHLVDPQKRTVEGTMTINLRYPPAPKMIIRIPYGNDEWVPVFCGEVEVDASDGDYYVTDDIPYSANSDSADELLPSDKAQMELAGFNVEMRSLLD